MPTDTGDSVPIRVVRYAIPGAAVVVAWIPAGLAMVDPAPAETGIPEWIDTGLVSFDGQKVRAVPGERCRWRRLGDKAVRHSRWEG